MAELILEHLQAYRAQTYRLTPALRLSSPDEAVAYANERGFIYFWPIKGVLLPSLWGAVAGGRPVADAHDDPGHITWGWKDSLLGARRWYYAKILRQKATMISLALLPYFYALSENYGAPEEDYLTLYEQGRMTQETRQVYEALLEKGPLDTIALRKTARLSSPESETRFNRALSELQRNFMILPVGVAEVGAWRYAFIYQITGRHFPDLPEQARPITENQARQALAGCYLRSVGAAQLRDLNRLFGWTPAESSKTLQALIARGEALGELSLTGTPGEWFASRTLLEPA